MSTLYNKYPDKFLIIGGEINIISDTQLAIEPIACKDHEQNIDIETTSNITVDFTTNGPNGLDTGSVQALTTYYIYALRCKPLLNDVPVVFVASLDPVSPEFPVALQQIKYDIYRQIGSVVTGDSGQLDTIAGSSLALKGSVNVYADLPETPDDINDIWLVRKPSGVYLINRKQAGLYGWNTGTLQWDHLGNTPSFFNDANFEIYNNADNTKIIKISASAITTGQTRTLSMPDRNLDLFKPIFNQITLDKLDTPPDYLEGLFYYDNVKKAFTMYSNIPGVSLQVGEELWVPVKNVSGSTINNGKVVYVSGANSGLPTIELASASTKITATTVIGLATHDILNGATGKVTIAGVVRDFDTSAHPEGTILYLSETPGEMTATEPLTPNYSVVLGAVIVSNATTGSFLVRISVGGNYQESFNLINGSILDEIDVDIVSSAGVVTLEMEKNGGGDIVIKFSDGFYVYDATPKATIVLNHGTDTNPQINYVYIDKADKLLKVSTTDFPSTEHAKIGVVYLRSASATLSDGAFETRILTDHVKDSNNQGHLSHLNNRLRLENTRWLSGALGTTAITTNVGTPDNVLFSNTEGLLLRLHKHTFPALTMATESVHIVNDSVSPFVEVSDLNAVLTDANGVSMAGKYFSLVIWGVVSEKTIDCHLMCNLPDSSYNNVASAEADANFDIPAEFIGAGFLISHLVLRHTTTSGGTWVIEKEIDLRGTTVGVGGSGGQSSTILANNVNFDDADSPFFLKGYLDVQTALNEVAQNTPANIRKVFHKAYFFEGNTAQLNGANNGGSYALLSSDMDVTATNGVPKGTIGQTYRLRVNGIGQSPQVRLSANKILAIGKGEYSAYFRAYICDNLPNATDQYSVNFGLSRASNPFDNTQDNIRIAVDWDTGTSSVKIKCYTHDGTSETVSVSNVTVPAVNSVMTFKIFVNADATQIYFYWWNFTTHTWDNLLDGLAQEYHSTNIPDNTLTPFVTSISDAVNYTTTANDLCLTFFGHSYKFTNYI